MTQKKSNKVLGARVPDVIDSGAGVPKGTGFMEKETMMSAEEFFGELEKGKTPVRKGGARGKKTGKDFFAELKVKMVMRIYGATRARAMEIIAGRAVEKDELERAKERAKRSKISSPEPPDGDLMSAEEFFGACD